jgi:uncharacterized protein YndB with AHSA1/START domain
MSVGRQRRAASPRGDNQTVDDSYTLSTTRVMPVPVDQIWAAWHDLEKIARWWGPSSFSSTVKELDVRKGGRFDVVMRGPDGTDYPTVYVFDRVEPCQRLVYTNQGSRSSGWPRSSR